jgi:GT2 family glycosyltransferase
MKARIGVVIVTYNNAEMLRSLLKDLTAQTRKADEIIIVDNASTDETGSVVREFPDITYLYLEENTGSAGGYHEGIKYSIKNNDFIWTLDDDITIKETSLEVLERWWDILNRNHRLGVIRSWHGDAQVLDSPVRISDFAWRGTFLKKEVILDVGLPLKDFFLYADDVEYSFRIARKGYDMFIITEALIREKRFNHKMSFFLFGEKKTFYKDRFRLYYAFRNQTNLYLKYRMFSKLFETFRYGFKAIFLLIIVKRTKCFGDIHAIIDGISDGLRDHLGKNKKYLPGY